MCGIAGFITKDGKQPKATVNQLSNMLIRAATRGRDATGIMYSTPDSDKTFKLPIEAEEFSNIVPWHEIKSSQTCLMHTRHATQGTPQDNDNNHPLLGFGVTLIHNGVIQNSNKFVSNHITDSYAILEAYNTEKQTGKPLAWNIKKSLKLLMGSMACAYYHHKEERLVLVKSGNPLCLGFKKNTIFFASTKYIINAVKPDSIMIMPDDYMLSIKGDYMKGYNIKTREEPQMQYYNDSYQTAWGKHYD